MAFLLLVGLSGAGARAQSPSQIENSRRARQSWVSDNAGVLSEAEERRINAVCAALKSQNGAELEVVTVRSLSGKAVRDYANEVAANLKIGKSGSDNGILLLNAVDERQISIKVGYGLEDVLPDGKTGEIRRNQIAPLLARKDYAGGLYAGALALAQVVAPNLTLSSDAADSAQTSDSTSKSQPSAERSFDPSRRDNPVAAYPTGGGLLVSLMGLLVVLFPMLLFAGMIWFFTAAMRRPLRCSKCRAPVKQLSDTAELASLSPVQQFEQQIGARDYRVWRCEKCHNEDITAHDLPYSPFAQCPTCRHQTASTLVETVRQPTHRRGGQERVILSCQWPACKHSNFYNRATLPMQRGGYGSGYGNRYGGSGGDLLTGIVLGSLLNNNHSGGNWGSGGDFGGTSGGDSGGGSGGFDSGPSDFGGGDFGGGGSDGGY